jgi:hypothetical protein
MTPLFHVSASSASDDLLVIHTPTTKDINVKALADSGATKNCCSDSYVREKLLSTNSHANPLRVRIADSSMRMEIHGLNIEFNIGSLKISQEFIVTRLSGPHQIILGYEFLKDFNPHIDWAAGTLRFSEMEIMQAIVSKQIAGVKHLSGKQISRLLKTKLEKNKKNRSLSPEPDDLRTYIGTLKQVHSSPISEAFLNAIQDYEDSNDVNSKIAIIETDFGADYTTKLLSILNDHRSALKPLLGLPVQRPDFDMRIDSEGPIPHSRVYRMSSSELEELKVQLKDSLERGWI